MIALANRVTGRLAATLTAFAIGAWAQGAQPVPADGERLDINPMLEEKWKKRGRESFP